MAKKDTLEPRSYIPKGEINMLTERMMIVDALIKVAMLIVTVILIPAAKGWIERNRDNKEIQLVLQMADIAVKSVENDLATEAGQVKKAEAMKRLAEQVASWGVKGFTESELNHYIETAVKEMWEEAIPSPVSIENEPVIVEEIAVFNDPAFDIDPTDPEY